MMRSFAIGDIHGCNRTLHALLDQLSLLPGDRLIFLGDYIDRGPDSQGVIDTIFELTGSGIETVCLRGNHEQLMLNGLHDPHWLHRWEVNGGEETLQSFGIDHPSKLPKRYLEFFNKTLYHYEAGRYICVHGGIDTAAADPLANPHPLMWSRYWYQDIDYAWLGNRIILHGHTPEEIGKIREQHRKIETQRYLNLDNGCVYAGRTGHARVGLGRLLAYCLETGELRSEEMSE